MGTTDRARSALAVAILLIAGCGAPAVSETATAEGPPSSPDVTCTGVPQARCDEAVAGALRSLPNTRIATIEVLCVADGCTDESGAMDTVVQTADGNTLRSPTTSWSAPAVGHEPSPGAEAEASPGAGGEGSPAASRSPSAKPSSKATRPPAPIKPICRGIPAVACQLMAETAFGELPTTGAQNVIVLCDQSEACTTTRGVGLTLVEYEDGSVQSSTWEYDLTN